LTNKRLREISNADLDLYASKRLEEGVGAWSINKELLCGACVEKSKTMGQAA
jgi:hypothetical protein